MKQVAPLLALAWLFVDCHAALRSSHAHDHIRTASDGLVQEGTALRIGTAAMETVLGHLMRHEGKHYPKHKATIAKKLREVDLRATVNRLAEKVPKDVLNLLHVTVEGKSRQPFPEESLAKALKVLNELLFKALNELDDVIIECKEFEDRNRGTYDQVMTDIARLAESIADFERLSAEAQENINVKEAEIQTVTAELKKETVLYTRILFEDRREMAIRKGDLAVFQFMMQLTKCEKESLLQLDKPKAKVCQTSHGFELSLEDAGKQAKLERMMTPGARKAVNELLGSMQATEAKHAAQLLQESAGSPAGKQDAKDLDDDLDDDDDDDDTVGSKGLQVEQQRLTALSSLLGTKTTVTNTSVQEMPAPPVEKEEVIKTVDVSQGWKKCTTGPPDCGLLHDNMSIMWGKFKDLVDELQQKMDKEAFEFEELKTNFNEQLDIMRNSKARFIMELNEATANLNSAREEMSEKEQERQELEHDFNAKMTECKKRMDWIKFQDYCAFLSVRVSTMSYSTVSPPEKIVDCELTDWVPGECSVSCDDECPDPTNPYGCGGWQTLTRDIMQNKNEFGHKCPDLWRKRKCNQIKCPVDCVMSEWSQYSACTRQECGGGTKGRTRDILVRPKNGGMSCNTVVEVTPCNTKSCDRDCRLKWWSRWSPCSVACGGGVQEKWRRVRVPIRGNGECPTETSSYRHQMQECNTHECAGDEICIAKQDLVIAIDGSGSLRQAGFDILKDWAASLVDKYMGEYHGSADMKVGVVQFGNGEVLEDGTISEATEIIELTSDMSAVKTAIEGLTWQKGFTNMAQAFSKAESILLRGGRKRAQSAVLTITDGKPSFLFQTNEKVTQLKDKNVKMFFAPITEFDGEEMGLMKTWASQPWQTNVVRIPGLEMLGADRGVFSQKVLVKFCPDAISPSSMMSEETTMGFFLVAEDGLCGAQTKMLSASAASAADCSALAAEAGSTAFSFGKSFAEGFCYAQDLEVTTEVAEGFKGNRVNPPCPGGEWKPSMLYDFYALEPMAMG